MTKATYSTAMVEEVLRLDDEHTPPIEIAARTGLTRGQVAGLLHRLRPRGASAPRRPRSKGTTHMRKPRRGGKNIRFSGTDWRADPRLRMCSAAARGVWIDLLTLMIEAEPYGHLLVNGAPPTAQEIGQLTCTPPDVVEAAISELGAAGVYSRTEEGVIFSRRLARSISRGDSNLIRESGAGIRESDSPQGVSPARATAESQGFSLSASRTIRENHCESETRAGARDTHSGDSIRGATLPDGFVVLQAWISEAAAERKKLGLPDVDLHVEARQFPLWAAAQGARSSNWRKSWLSFALKARAEWSNLRGAKPSDAAATMVIVPWDKRTEGFRRTGFWLAAWGARPGESGCCAPDDMLTERERAAKYGRVA